MPHINGTPTHSFLFVAVIGYVPFTEREGDHRAAEVATTLADTARRAAGDCDAEFVAGFQETVMVHAKTARAAIAVAVRTRRDLAVIPGFPPVRAGIHTGPAASAGGDWFGATVNLAYRTARAAGPSEILCSAEALAAAALE